MKVWGTIVFWGSGVPNWLGLESQGHSYDNSTTTPKGTPFRSEGRDYKCSRILGVVYKYISSFPGRCINQSHTYIHTCMHACIHTYIHIYIYTYTDVYVHVWYLSPKLFFFFNDDHIPIFSAVSCLSGWFAWAFLQTRPASWGADTATLIRPTCDGLKDRPVDM